MIFDEVFGDFQVKNQMDSSDLEKLRRATMKFLKVASLKPGYSAEASKELLVSSFPEDLRWAKEQIRSLL